MIKKKTTNILLILSIAVFLFGSGYKIGEYKTARTKISRPNYNILNAKNPELNSKENPNNLDFSLFWEVWNQVEKKFIDKKKLAPEKMLYGAIKGMVSSLDDPYTFFLTPDENKRSKDDLEGKFEGIGAQLGLKDSRIIIIAPLKNSPAESAGVKAGDFIAKVNNESTKNWTLYKAVTKIRGTKGTKVTLTLERDGKEVKAVITRDQINVPSVELSYEKSDKYPNKRVAYIKINQFGDLTNQEWDKAVKEITPKWKNSQIKGLIVDVRDNPGGFLNSSVYLASEFLPIGKVVVKQESSNDKTRVYNVERQGNLIGIPLIILINKGSASASEILAGSLRDHKAATLEGEKTFGKGSVQEALDLTDGAGLHVTIAKWILPNGDWINSKGIKPKIEVKNKIKKGNTLERKDDKQLEKAINILLK